MTDKSIHEDIIEGFLNIPPPLTLEDAEAIAKAKRPARVNQKHKKNSNNTDTKQTRMLGDTSTLTTFANVMQLSADEGDRRDFNIKFYRVIGHSKPPWVAWAKRRDAAAQSNDPITAAIANLTPAELRIRYTRSKAKCEETSARLKKVYHSDTRQPDAKKTAAQHIKNLVSEGLHTRPFEDDYVRCSGNDRFKGLPSCARCQKFVEAAVDGSGGHVWRVWRMCHDCITWEI